MSSTRVGRFVSIARTIQYFSWICGPGENWVYAFRENSMTLRREDALGESSYLLHIKI